VRTSSTTSCARARSDMRRAGMTSGVTHASTMTSMCGRTIARTGGANVAGWIVAMIHVRVNTRIGFVHQIGAMRASIG
jgi:hypothetical protein